MLKSAATAKQAKLQAGQTSPNRAWKVMNNVHQPNTQPVAWWKQWGHSYLPPLLEITAGSPSPQEKNGETHYFTLLLVAVTNIKGWFGQDIPSSFLFLLHKQEPLLLQGFSEQVVLSSEMIQLTSPNRSSPLCVLRSHLLISKNPRGAAAFLCNYKGTPETCSELIRTSEHKGKI